MSHIPGPWGNSTPSRERLDEAAGTAARRCSADGKTLHIRSSHDANTVRLLALDVTTSGETVIAEDPQYDIG
jgi:hypothetical protein